LFQLVFADQKSRVFEHPQLTMLGRSGDRLVKPRGEDMIPLPEGASLILLPGRAPGGGERRKKGTVTIDANPYGGKGGPVTAVAALLPQGYTRTLLPGYVTRQDVVLPLYGYAAVGWREGRFYVAAVQTDEDDTWNPRHFNTDSLEELVEQRLATCPANRILRQLSVCALEYGCYTAQNIFYRRWEGGIPVSPTCNARCVGCISLQPSECCPSPQERINFSPSVEEIVEVAVPHLEGADQGIVSFGQGCEGEPALAARPVAEAIRNIRSSTSRGTINMNSNAGFTEGVREVVTAGLDSIRVSLNSPDPEKYLAYYRSGYSLTCVAESLKFAAREGTLTSLNLLVFPGVTDEVDEIERLVEFVRNNELKMIQLRNLNIDPDVYTRLFPVAAKTVGMSGFVRVLRDRLPGVTIGSYSRPARNRSGNN